LAGTVVTVVAAEFRSQRQNRSAARERLAALLADALAPPPAPRRATRPTRSSIDRRLAGKRHRGETKRRRARPEDM
jgi:ribosome-associated protein